MTRSIKKGLYVDESILKKIEGKAPLQTPMIKTWKRASQISPEMIGFTFGVYNGRKHIPVMISEDMIGQKFGEYSPTRTYYGHGADKKAKRK